MRLPLVLLVALLACKETAKEPPRKLRKMDFKVQVDERGRMNVMLELFDEKHRTMPVTGAFTATLARPDGTILCSTTRPLTKDDFSDKGSFKPTWQDAACPPDPAADDLRVTLEVKTGDAPDAPKLSREATIPAKYIYQRLPANTPSPPVDAKKLPAEAPLPEPPPASGSAPPANGSAAPPAQGSAAPPAPPPAPGSGSAA